MSDSDSSFKSICTQEHNREEHLQKLAHRIAREELLDLLNAPAIQAEEARRVEKMEKRARRVAAEVEDSSDSDAASIGSEDEDFWGTDDSFIKRLVIYLTDLTKVDN